jgi:PleD family two-component response regulator
MTDTIAAVESSPSYSTNFSAGGLPVVEYVRDKVDKQASGAQTWIATDGSLKASTKLRVLLVEDNACDVDLEFLTLQRDGFDVSGDVAQSPEEFTARIQMTNYDLILADHNLPQWRGLRLSTFCAVKT